MLAFFRKYERSWVFIGLIFLPALLGLGMTSALTDVLGGGGNPEDEVLGAVDGEEITRGKFERTARLYRATNPYAQEEDAWRFMALLRAARAAGIWVSDEEVGDNILSDIRWDIAQYKAAEECRAEGIDLSSEAGRAAWQGKFMKYMMQSEFDADLYPKVLAQQSHGNLSIPEYEEQVRRQAIVTRYLDALRAMAVVPPSAVWDEFQDQNHRRKLGLITISAEAHRPDVAAVGSDAPGVISDAQVADFYEMHRDDFDVARRVRFELLAVSLEAAEQSLTGVTDEELAAYFDVHRAEIAPLTTRTYADLIAEELIDDDKVRKPLLAQKARELADALLDPVVSRIAAAEAAGEKPDLAAIGSAVRDAAPSGALLKFMDTGLIDETELADHPLLGGSMSGPANRWFRVATLGDLSDALAGAKAWYVLRVAEVKAAVSPDFADIKDAVREAYANGSPNERRRAYEQGKYTRYLQDTKYDFEYVLAADEKFPGEKSHEEARAFLQKAFEEVRSNLANGADGWGPGWSLSRLSGLKLPNVTNLLYGAEQRAEGVTRADLEKHPVLGNIASTLASLEEGVLNAPIETKDGKGWVCVRLKDRADPRPKAFAEAEAQVKEDVRLQRGLERAQAAADALVSALRGLTGSALQAAITARKLEVKESEAFARTATSLEGIADAGRLVGQAFSAEAKVDGPFDATVADTIGNRVFVLRVTGRVDAPDTDYQGAAPNLRRELLSKARGDYATSETRRTYLAAKGITPEHLRYAVANRDGPGGETRLTLRQVFIAPDRELIDGWVAESALTKAREAEADLRQGRSWDPVVDKYTEDDDTRSRHGELPPMTKNELGQELGDTFAEEAFGLAEGATSGPLKSAVGYHLVQRQGTRGGKAVFRHVLVRTDAAVRKLPDDVRDRAWEASRRRMDEALEKLKTGQSFAQVAETYGDIQEPNGQGQDFEVDHVTPFERAALEEVVDYDYPEGSSEAKDPLFLPQPVEVKNPDGSSTWQLFACARSPEDREFGSSPRRDRLVYHVESKSRQGADRARERLATWLKKQYEKEEDRPPFSSIQHELSAIARDVSEAADKSKGGAFGLVTLEGAVRAYGAAFLSQIAAGPDGKPVAAGHRTAVFRGETGWHLVEVVLVHKADEQREGIIADLLLRGTDWRQ